MLGNKSVLFSLCHYSKLKLESSKVNKSQISLSNCSCLYQMQKKVILKADYFQMKHAINKINQGWECLYLKQRFLHPFISQMYHSFSDSSELRNRRDVYFNSSNTLWAKPMRKKVLEQIWISIDLQPKKSGRAAPESFTWMKKLPSLGRKTTLDRTFF